ncbi:hypothetical protein C2I18_00110 [Paenibacillus sp. PK3_47]|uniref:hypothetical protein n=1 Tax=Paenibacillus sp. PK3_47 TaxID=2072642 RepID=UPI00201E2FC2|nr:hypothetical protein [Paenibacillus sp. PK3_47]UQZ32090.1 hypothetical protein C2I18_00110 [Paenibacillus sp. PK3_47]
MTLRPVELQIALPRTTDAGKIQNELQQRPSLDQQQLAGQNIKQSTEMTQRSPEIDESPDAALRNDGRRGNRQGSGMSGSRQQKQEPDRIAEHPYKGHSIDLSL